MKKENEEVLDYMVREGIWAAESIGNILESQINGSLEHTTGANSK